MKFRAYLRGTVDERWAEDVELGREPVEDEVVALDDGRRVRVTHVLDQRAGYDGAFVGEELPALD